MAYSVSRSDTDTVQVTGVGFSETVIALGGHTRRFSRMGVRATDVFFAL